VRVASCGATKTALPGRLGLRTGLGLGLAGYSSVHWAGVTAWGYRLGGLEGAQLCEGDRVDAVDWAAVASLVRVEAVDAG